ncbi:MAG: DUF1134 domain-containing protein [Pseudomonadota bacterium]
MKFLKMFLATLLLSFGMAAGADDAPPDPPKEDTFTQDEVLVAANSFFGSVTEGLAKAIERVLADLGRPNAYIAGEEAGGAFTVGLRYGKGQMKLKNGYVQKIYWQAPSIGFDVGGNASKVFTLVYNLRRTEDLFQRFPNVDGSAYFIAGLGVNYQRTDDITLAPIRTGVGFRLGASIGYVHYTPKSTWLPF